MQGIDISGWQAGINVAAVPADFVIVKATQGTSFVNKEYNTQINQAANAGRLLGVYHYIGGQGADAEMTHFYNTIKPWIGKALICLDWESEQNSQWGNTNYLRQCIEKIKALTGKTIVVYASKSVFPFDLVNSTGCKAWVAQYANMNATWYQENPWNEGAYTCLIRQYSSAGRLSGYNGNLDINKAYCTRDEWNKLAGGGNTVEPSKPNTPEGYNIWMQAKANGINWPIVHNNNDNAGIDAPMTYLSVWSEPGTIMAQARTERGGWLPELVNPSNLNDLVNGAIGDGSPITGIRLYYNSPNGDKAVHYRVKVEGGGWLPWMIDHKDTGGSSDTFAGNGKRIQRIEAYIGGLT